jgi:hypothetical protein
MVRQRLWLLGALIFVDSLPHSRSFRPRRALSPPLGFPLENLSPPDSASLVEARMAS